MNSARNWNVTLDFMNSTLTDRVDELSLFNIFVYMFINVILKI
jgi:hypothetical protein